MERSRSRSTTANGDTFDQKKLTAAHRTLPLGSKALVTNLKTGKSVEVTINDRGRVIAARMTKPIHPVYDQQLLRAALSWTYKPALRDGAPTIFVKLITINLDTRPLCSPRSIDACRPPLDTR